MKRKSPINKREPIDRFMEKVFKHSNGCWIWLGYTTSKGYGTFGPDQHPVRAHRWIYEYYNGPLGDLLCLHECNHPSCVNPDHLYAGTGSDNMQDRIKAGNDPKLNKKFCPQGHPYDEWNTRIYKGARICIACNDESRIEYQKGKHLKNRLILSVGTRERL